GRAEQWLKAGVLDRGRFAPTEQGCPQGGGSTPPTRLINFAHVTLRVGWVVVAAAAAAAAGRFPDRDAVADGDLFRSDEDVLDQQAQDPAAVFGACRGGAAVQPGQEAFQAGGELEVGVPV